jgi:hypothetical protein
MQEHRNALLVHEILSKRDVQDVLLAILSINITFLKGRYLYLDNVPQTTNAFQFECTTTHQLPRTTKRRGCVYGGVNYKGHWFPNFLSSRTIDNFISPMIFTAILFSNIG